MDVAIELVLVAGTNTIYRMRFKPVVAVGMRLLDIAARIETRETPGLLLDSQHEDLSNGNTHAWTRLSSRRFLLHIEHRQVARFWLDGGENMLGPVTLAL